MRTLLAAFLLLGVWSLEAQADQPLIEMPCGQINDYRQDFLFRFVGIVQLPPVTIADYEHLPPNATAKEREDKLVDLKLDALLMIEAEHNLVDFYLKHHYPPKSDAIIAPVTKFIQSEAFQKEEKQLPLAQHDIERADFAQTKAILEHFAKIPLPSRQQMEVYIDEAVYGGSPPAARW
jgi:hypothetical protein